MMDERRCGVDERLLLTLVLHARDHRDKRSPAKSLFLAQHNSCGLVDCRFDWLLIDWKSKYILVI